MAPVVLSLREYRNDVVHLEPVDAAALAALARSDAQEDARIVESLTPGPVSGTYVVRPGPVVGRFRLHSGTVVEIASRFRFQSLPDVLGVAATNTVLARDDLVTATEHPGAADVVARSLLRQVRDLVGSGLVKGYVARRFVRPPYPGAPDVGHHLSRHGGRADRLVTRANRLTPDVAANRVVAAAVQIIVDSRLFSPRVVRAAQALAPAFQRVKAVPEPLAELDTARRAAPPRYSSALDLAAVVLRGRTTVPAGTGAVGASMLFAMPGVWEDYVLQQLRSTVPPGHRVFPQHPVRLTDGPVDLPAMRARADAVEVGTEETPVAVYDAKYKEWSDTPRAADLYQILAYASRLKVARAILVYPGIGQEVVRSVDGVRVHLRGLPVLAGALSASGAPPRIAFSTG